MSAFCYIFLAEKARFELALGVNLLSVFETDPFSRLGISPLLFNYTFKINSFLLNIVFRRSIKRNKEHFLTKTNNEFFIKINKEKCLEISFFDT